MGKWGAALVVAAVLAIGGGELEAQRRGRRAPLPPGTIEARITGLRSGDGRIACAIFDDGDAFPADRERAIEGKLVPIQNGIAVCRFQDMRPGTYAIAFIHDEDADGEFDTGLFGIPTEGYGASRNAHSSFGPPDWEDARFDFDGSALRMRLRTRY